MTRKFTQEHLERKRIAATGKKYPNRKPMSEEQKAKLRMNYQIKSKDLPPPTTDIRECKKCSRMYLPKLGCLFCDVYDKNSRIMVYK